MRVVYKEKETSTSTSTNKNTIEIPKSIYFGGAACSIIYYVGVIEQMKLKWGNDFYKKTIVCGGSAGSFIGLLLSIGMSAKQMVQDIHKIGSLMIENPTYWSGHDYYMCRYLHVVCAQDELLYKKIEHRYRVYMTEFFDKTTYYDSWSSNDDLIACIKGSVNVPLYCSYAEPYKGVHFVDGAYGMDYFSLPHGNETLFVGINQPIAEISRFIPIYKLMIPNIGDEFVENYRTGQDDFGQWNGIYTEKQNRKPNVPALIFCWCGKMLQIVYFFFSKKLNGFSYYG